MLCTAIEVNLAIMAASLPSLYALLKQMTPGSSKTRSKLLQSNSSHSKPMRQRATHTPSATYSVNAIGGGDSGELGLANESEETIRADDIDSHVRVVKSIAVRVDQV